jgi:galactokinase
MTASQWRGRLESMEGRALLARLYGREAESGRARITSLLQTLPGDAPAWLFSTPGRTELGGNHTDHNHGRVLAAAVHLDALAAVTPRDDGIVLLRSRGFDRIFRVDLGSRDPMRSERGGFEALIRGVAARFGELGLQVGGFEGAIDSLVLPGSGLSSSAAVEVLLGTILSHLYNRGSVPPLELAKIGQYAENHYFGKPCGLMDQTACATGGIIAIDFRDPEEPLLDRVDYSFEGRGYLLAIVDTGGSHEDLTPDYAACPREMFSAAKALGKDSARQINRDELMRGIPSLRKSCGDRAILRVLHFMNENERAEKMIESLRRDDLTSYLELMRASSDSSWRLLQNCFSPKMPQEQGISLAIAVGETLVKGDAAFRVHGGGFAGTVQALIPAREFPAFRIGMEKIFGEGCVTSLRLRPEGTLRL